MHYYLNVHFQGQSVKVWRMCTSLLSMCRGRESIENRSLDYLILKISGTTVFRSVGNYSPNCTATRTKSSAKSLWGRLASQLVWTLRDAGHFGKKRKWRSFRRNVRPPFVKNQQVSSRALYLYIRAPWCESYNTVAFIQLHTILTMLHHIWDHPMLLSCPSLVFKIILHTVSFGRLDRSQPSGETYKRPLSWVW